MDEDMDGEALQAQVDKSLARVNEIVASWVMPFKGSVEATKARELVERDIEYYSARPPRLGVGAVYEPQNTDARDAARLRGRLMQKKRATSPGSSTQAQQKEQDQGATDEDEEDSRTKMFSKPSKSQTLGAVDKFSTKAKKKAKAGASAPSINSITVTSGANEKGEGPSTSSVQSPASPTRPSMLPPSSTQPLSRSHSQSQSQSPTSNKTNIFTLSRTPASPSVPLLLKQPTFGEPQDEDSDADGHGDGDEDQSERGDTPSPLDEKQGSIQQAQGDKVSSPKRKRKRRKKKHVSNDSQVDSQLPSTNLIPTSTINAPPNNLYIQLPPTRMHPSKPSPSPGALTREDSLAPSEARSTLSAQSTQSAKSLATNPPLSASASALSSRANSPGSSLSRDGGGGMSQETPTSPSTSITTATTAIPTSPFKFTSPHHPSSSTAAFAPLMGVSASPRRTPSHPHTYGHVNGQGGLSRRQKLYEKIAAKERQNALARKEQAQAQGGA